MSRYMELAAASIFVLALAAPASAQSKQNTEAVAMEEIPKEGVPNYTQYTTQALQRALDICGKNTDCPETATLTKDEFSAYCVQTLLCTASVDPVQAELPPVLVEQLNINPPYYYGWHMNQGVTYSICNSLRCNTVGGVRLGVVIWLSGRTVTDFRMSIDPDRGPAVSGTFNYRCARFIAGEPGCNSSWNIPVQYVCDGYTPDKCESFSDSFSGHTNNTFYWSHKWSWKSLGHPGFTWNIPNPGFANTPFYQCSSSPNDCHFRL